MSRRQREKRAYQLVLATGGFGVGAVVTFVIAVLTPFGLTIPFLLLVAAAVCGFLLQRTLSP